MSTLAANMRYNQIKKLKILMKYFKYFKHRIITYILFEFKPSRIANRILFILN